MMRVTHVSSSEKTSQEKLEHEFGCLFFGQESVLKGSIEVLRVLVCCT